MSKTLSPSAVTLHNVNVTDFLSVLDSCKGSVYLITRDGSHLNLKSRLCQLVGLTQLITDGNIGEACLICEKKEDESRLFRFNLLGDLGSRAE